ncbi:uncharacterized protein LOC129858542 [Salvelinus fontinalis]|uniref:uncharacterized protein LOC129858542 n=1 Tax=Salvelinus fontinalis TaxID=8038 RepID=UPI002484F999|nr:uncharacterized protein LOC129858542 [Salvelinus fontinalis]
MDTGHQSVNQDRQPKPHGHTMIGVGVDGESLEHGDTTIIPIAAIRGVDSGDVAVQLDSHPVVESTQITGRAEFETPTVQILPSVQDHATEEDSFLNTSKHREFSLKKEEEREKVEKRGIEDVRKKYGERDKEKELSEDKETDGEINKDKDREKEKKREEQSERQHMQTQVSLEVDQHHSVATSPMTPPQGVGADAFPFPAASRSLEVVQYHSVATSPMTPPQGVGADAFLFPAASRSLEVVQYHSVATSPMTPPQGVGADAFPFPAASRSLEVVKYHAVATSPMTPPQGVGADAFPFPAASRSLEVVQYHAVATSPMTPPQGAGAPVFLFQLASMGPGVETKDAELQEGHQLEFCSVTTASIASNNTPTVPAAFPELSRREDEARKEVRRNKQGRDERESTSDSVVVTPRLMSSPVLKCSALKEDVAEETKSQSNIPPDSSVDSDPQTDRLGHNYAGEPAPVEVKRRGRHGATGDAVDQEITILVTHHDSFGVEEEEEEEEEEERRGEERREDIMSFIHCTEPEGSVEVDNSEGVKVVPPVPQNSLDDGRSDDTAQPKTTRTVMNLHSHANRQEDSLPPSGEDIRTETKQMTSPQSLTKNKHPEHIGEESKLRFSEEQTNQREQCSLVDRNGTAQSNQTEQRSLVDSSGSPQPNQTEQLQPPLIGPPVPGFLALQQQTQVSLEVAQHHSVATSPMTPPQGAGADAFLFPAASRSLEVVQYHSVATSPMTPPQGVGADAFVFPAASRSLEVVQYHSVATSPMTPPQGVGADAFIFPAASRSLEVVQYHSVATSPMTPPQGAGADAFLFPAASRSLEVVQYHSVATSPMTPPQGAGAPAFLFPAASRRMEVVQYHSVATSPMTPPQGVGADAFIFPAASRSLEVVQYHSVATSPMTPPQGAGADAFLFPAASRSLEVVQYHSVATSPMTPPQGAGAPVFLFQLASMGPGVETKDAELQEGHQLEFCSVTTASMASNNTPTVPAVFPELSRREDEARKEVRREKQGRDERESTSDPVVVTPRLMSAPVLKCSALKEDVAEETKSQSNIPPDSSVDSDPQTEGLGHNYAGEPAPVEVKRRGRHGATGDAVDQEITILVTHHDSFGVEEEEEEEEEERRGEERREDIMSFIHCTEPEGSVEVDNSEGVKVVPPVPQNSLDDGRSDDTAQPKTTGTVMNLHSHANRQEDSLPPSGEDIRTETKQMTSPQSLTKNKHPEHIGEESKLRFSEEQTNQREQCSLVDRRGTPQSNQTEQRSLVDSSGTAQSNQTEQRSLVDSSGTSQSNQTEQRSLVDSSGTAQSNQTEQRSLVDRNGTAQSNQTEQRSLVDSSGTAQSNQTEQRSLVDRRGTPQPNQTEQLQPPLIGPPVPGSLALQQQTQVSLEVAQHHSVATSPMTPSQGAGADAFPFPAASRSLEVVQYHSVATSPMTPPQGVGADAFLLPSSSRRMGVEFKDTELQVGRQVEFHSVSTAPRFPKPAPAAPAAFPELSGREGEEKKEEKRAKERKVEESTKEKKEERREEEPDKQTEDKNKEGKTKETTEEKRSDELVQEVRSDELVQEVRSDELVQEVRSDELVQEVRSDELVQEVRWDERGMTWEVYGAVVEVAVLGSAIQKHLEKQVQKLRKHPSPALPPPPPLNPAAMPLPTTLPLKAATMPLHSTPPPLNPAAMPLPTTPPPASGTTQVLSGKGSTRKRGEPEGKRSRRRRNPFRLLLKNMQQHKCCSRAHSTE